MCVCVWGGGGGGLLTGDAELTRLGIVDDGGLGQQFGGKDGAVEGCGLHLNVEIVSDVQPLLFQRIRDFVLVESVKPTIHMATIQSLASVISSFDSWSNIQSTFQSLAL